jgi:DNA polymerase III beta subunit, N-terminal domain
MEFSVSKSALLNELTTTQGVVERKTTIPILSNLLFVPRRFSVFFPHFTRIFITYCAHLLHTRFHWLGLTGSGKAENSSARFPHSRRKNFWLAGTSATNSSEQGRCRAIPGPEGDPSTCMPDTCRTHEPDTHATPLSHLRHSRINGPVIPSQGILRASDLSRFGVGELRLYTPHRPLHARTFAQFFFYSLSISHAAFSSPNATSKCPSAGITSIGNPPCHNATPSVKLLLLFKSRALL